MENNKKGLAIIYDPHAFMQFLQLYSMNEYDVNWDALCLPKDGGKEEMHEFCEKVGIFESVFIGEQEFKKLGAVDKFFYFSKMFAGWITRNQKEICKKTFCGFGINIDNYDVVVSNSENGFVSGITATLAKEMTIIFLEDGLGDYVYKRRRWKSVYSVFSFMNIQCVLMARMGYFGAGYTYFDATKNAIRYVSNPNELRCSNFREVRSLVLHEEERKKYSSLLDLAYPELSKIKVNEGDAILFTDPVELDCENYLNYVEAYIKYISDRHERIILKPHPREDVSKYTFPDKSVVEFVSRDIPAEAILPHLKGNTCYFMLPNSIWINMNGYNLNAKVLFSERICRETNQSVEFLKDRVDVVKYCDRFMQNRYEIVDLED